MKEKVIKNRTFFAIQLLNGLGITNTFCSGLLSLTRQPLLQDLLIRLNIIKAIMHMQWNAGQMKNKSLSNFRESLNILKCLLTRTTKHSCMKKTSFKFY